MKRLALYLILAAGLPAVAQDKTIAREHAFGCADSDYYSSLVGFAVQKDEAAFKKGLLAGMLREQCATFTVGQPVYLENTKMFRGQVQIRRKGETKKYWTAMENVR